LDFFAEGHEGIRNLAFEYAHEERSREPRFPSQQHVELSGAASLSARSGWAEVKALTERRGRGLVRNEGEAKCFARGGARRDYLDPPIQWRDPDGGRC
jgi:hypothetical protein